MQGHRNDTEPLNVLGHLTIRWDPDSQRFHLRVWVRDLDDEGVRNLTPEWAEVVVLEDDEWATRTLTKYVCSLAQVTREAADDVATGRQRLF